MAHSEKHFILHCSLIDGIGPVAVQQVLPLLATFSVTDLYTFTVTDFVHNRCSVATAQKLVKGLADSSLLEKELAAIEKRTISWTVFDAPDYPPLLATIYAPPPVLYWYGRSPHEYTKNLAIVGSRQANEYAQRVITTIVEQAVAHDIAIVSGGALGADTMAHKQAVHAQGNTIVVLGSGLAHLFPTSNIRLFNHIAQNGGTVLSIFPINLLGFAGNFPARNRVIAGLSQVTVVVQAAHKSGALITANYALDQGREVMAVPGPIDNPLHDGCHTLIQQGAGLVHTASDILVHFGIEKSIPIQQPAKQIEEQSLIKELPQKIEQTLPQKTSAIFVSKEKKIATASVSNEKKVPVTLSLTEMQKSIMDACKNPCTIDELSTRTSLPISSLYAEVLTLQMQALLIEDFAGRLSAVAL